MEATTRDGLGLLVAAVQGVEDWEVSIVLTYDDDADTSHLEQEGWEDRLAEFRRGEFYYVRVSVRIVSPHGTTLESVGLRGVESDSGEDYFRSIAEDELWELGASNIWNASTLPIHYF